MRYNKNNILLSEEKDESAKKLLNFFEARDLDPPASPCASMYSSSSLSLPPSSPETVSSQHGCTGLWFILLQGMLMSFAES